VSGGRSGYSGVSPSAKDAGQSSAGRSTAVPAAAIANRWSMPLPGRLPRGLSDVSLRPRPTRARRLRPPNLLPHRHHPSNRQLPPGTRQPRVPGHLSKAMEVQDRNSSRPRAHVPSVSVRCVGRGRRPIAFGIPDPTSWRRPPQPTLRPPTRSRSIRQFLGVSVALFLFGQGYRWSLVQA
jgi:hypothetical protein